LQRHQQQCGDQAETRPQHGSMFQQHGPNAQLTPSSFFCPVFPNPENTEELVLLRCSLQMYRSQHNNIRTLSWDVNAVCCGASSQVSGTSTLTGKALRHNVSQSASRYVPSTFKNLSIDASIERRAESEAQGRAQTEQCAIYYMGTATSVV
jgi:hypothetical protein